MQSIATTADQAAEGRFEEYFRDRAMPLDALRLWRDLALEINRVGRKAEQEGWL